MPEEIRIILKNGEPRPISDFDAKETIDILYKTADKLAKHLEANMLEPCPFCGVEISVDNIHCVGTEYSGDNFVNQVICPKCGACGPIGYTKSRSAEHWNTRKQRGNENEN